MSNLLVKIQIALSVFGALLLLSAPADAYDVCGTIRHWDNRARRSDVAGSHVVTSSNQTNRPVATLRVELWDQDGDCQDFLGGCDETDDDYLDFDVTDANGWYCMTQSGVQDIYLKTNYTTAWGEVRSSTSGIVRTSKTIFVNTTNRYSHHWNATCWNDDPLISFPAANTMQGICGTGGPQNTTNTWVLANYLFENSMTNILATLIDVDTYTVDSVLNRNGHTNRFIGYYPDTSPAKCTGSNLAAWSYDNLCTGSAANAANNHRVAHEVGHLVHQRALGYGGSLTSGASCGNSSWTAVEDEKCATAEGWANFFSVAMHFDSWSAFGWYNVTGRNIEQDTAQGNQYPDKCVNYHQNPVITHTSEGNVARFFWDLYDYGSAGDDGQDNAYYSLDDLVARWDFFWSCSTISGCNNEAGPDGRNVWDYEYFFYSTINEPELAQNCLSGQETF